MTHPEVEREIVANQTIWKFEEFAVLSFLRLSLTNNSFFQLSYLRTQHLDNETEGSENKFFAIVLAFVYMVAVHCWRILSACTQCPVLSRWLLLLPSKGCRLTSAYTNTAEEQW